ncbi:MAG: DUF3842 family protein [Nitrospira sp.]|nr:DUF3842 family protein [Nitrospira sp.]MDR4467425.1 DUF3842 family protein [Nitrospira sp.]
MRVCVIDGRGGGLGSRLVSGLRETLNLDCLILALGTNRSAAEAMRDAGAEQVACGEKAISELVPTADVIVASLNVVLPGAMLGEVTQEIARTILAAKAKKVLLPLNRVRVEIVGTEGRTMDTLIHECLSRVRVAVEAPCRG